MRFALIAGLVLRHGARTIELVRQLSDDEYQFEDAITRRPFTIKRLLLLKRIWDRTYEVIVDGAGGGCTPSPKEWRGGLDSLTPKVRMEIERRLAYLNSMSKGHVTRGQRARLSPIIARVAERRKDKRPPSPSTLMTWARKFQTSGLNPLALRSGNAHRIRQPRIHPLMRDLLSWGLRTVWLTRDRFSLQHTLDCILREAKKLVAQQKLKAQEATFSLATLSRRTREIDLYRRIAAREGHARARMVCRTVMGGAGAAYPLQRVEVDHTPLNWVVVCDRTGLPLGRPLLTVIIDSYSNYVLGLYLSFYGAGVSSVSGVLRNAIKPKDDFTRGVMLSHKWIAFGIPDEIFVDNGLEFHARVFQLMAWELAADLTYCRVRTPWLKPHVERFFATLDYLTLARGRVHKRVANVMNLDPRKDAAIKFTDLVKGLIMFITDVYPFEINERKLARPYDLMLDGLERCPPASFPPDMDALRMTTALSKSLTVGPGGIELRGLPYGREELLPMRSRYGSTFKTLIKWDPDEMESIWVQDPISKSWLSSPCRWDEYARGLSWNQHITIRSFAKKELKLKGAYEDLMASRLKLHDHWLEATSHKTTADSKLAAQFSGVTSATVQNRTAGQTIWTPENAVADIEIPQPQPIEVPDFEVFEIA
ncbi:MAG: transposase family protein [Rhodocyclaceae bacterium]